MGEGLLHGGKGDHRAHSRGSQKGSRKLLESGSSSAGAFAGGEGQARVSVLCFYKK